jgi:signal transduction histidine kinase
MPGRWSLRSLPIKTRLRIFFGSVVLLMLLGSTLSFLQFRSVTQYANRAGQAERRMTMLLRLNAALITLMSRLHRAAEYRDPGLFDREAHRLLQEFQQRPDNSGELQDLATESSIHEVLVGSIREMLKNLPARVDSFVHLAAAGDWEALHARLLNQVDRTDDVVAAVMQQADEDLATAGKQLTDDLHRAQNRAAKVLLITAIVSLFAAVVLGTLLTRTIARPLDDLRAGTTALAAGAFDHRVPVDGNDELAHLAAAFNRTAGELGRLFEEVRRVNADLQQFAYSASHDLQEPLRTVALYSQLFQRKYAGHIDATADQYLTYMLRAARQQEQLLRDLLAYTQTNAAKNQGEYSTDVDAVLERVLLALELQIREHNCVVTASALPAVKVPEVHVHQVLQNLIANAIRYRGDSAPEIRISAERQKDMCTFTVADNGIGIDPVYAKQIFGIFKRLHGTKYPGTGIGLAICQKIVEGYGGTIWVESELGRGATFRFTFPAA